jgi:hypothetical protein
MKLEEALKHIEVLRSYTETNIEYVLLNELELFIKQQGEYIHKQDNQLLVQTDWLLENKKLKAKIKDMEVKIEKVLNEF